MGPKGPGGGLQGVPVSQGLPWGKEPRAQRQSSPLCPTLGCVVPWAPQTTTDAGSLGSCLLIAGPGRPELGRQWDEEGTAPKVQSCPLLPAAHCPHGRGRGDWASAGQLRPLVAAVGRGRTCRQRANPIPSPAPRILCTALTYWRVAPGPARGEESGQAPPCSRGLPNGIPQEEGDLPQLQALRPQQTCPLCPSLAPKPCSQLLD